MRLFRSRSKEALLERWMKGNALYDNGESRAARRIYEPLISDAERLFGPASEETFALRGSLANTYREDEPDRARAILEQVVVECERTFGPGDIRCFPERLDLAAVRGALGDYAACHELSSALVTDCQRQLGPEHEKTSLARQLATWSGDDLVQPELARLLDLGQESLQEEAGPADWPERFERCVEATRAASSYRARLAMRSWGASESGALNLLATYVAPDRFHVKQQMWDGASAADSGQSMHDEWFMLGNEYYEPFIGALVAVAGETDAGLLQQTGRERKEMNDLVVADSYVALLQDNRPRVSVRRGDEAAYLVAKYPVVPTQLFSEQLFDDTVGITRQGTTLWIDLDDNTLRRAAMILDAQIEGEHLRIGARHGFASYNDDLTISPPPGMRGVTLST